MSSDTGASRPRGSGGFGMMRYGQRNPPVDPTTSFEGKNILIVGATAGIGHDAAVKFAKLGADRLIIGARNLETAADVKRRIADSTPLPLERIGLYEIDMISPKSIEGFCKTITALEYPIHVAIINAGVAVPSFQLSSSGWEKSLQVEVLGKALCAIRLLPKLKTSAESSGQPSILQITGSEAYLDVEESWLPKLEESTTILKYYNDPAKFNMEKQYRMAKLLLMFVQQGICEALLSTSTATATSGSNTSPIVVVSSPGMTRTSLGRDFSYVMQALMMVMHYFTARTSEQGSRTLVSGAALGREADGKFWKDDGLNLRDPVLGKNEWNARQKVEFEGVLDVLEGLSPGTRAILNA